MTRIFLDLFHFMDRLLRLLSKKHSLTKKFSRAFSDTMLVPCAEDRKKMEAFLKSKDKTWMQVRHQHPAWLWMRVRRFIPEPSMICELLTELFESWGSAICSRTKLPLFSADATLQSTLLIADAKRGWVSDPPGVSMYVDIRIDRNGFVIRRCLRGTNSVEGGVHTRLRRKLGFLNGSPLTSEATLCDFRHRYNHDVCLPLRNFNYC